MNKMNTGQSSGRARTIDMLWEQEHNHTRSSTSLSQIFPNVSGQVRNLCYGREKDRQSEQRLAVPDRMDTVVGQNEDCKRMRKRGKKMEPAG